MKIVHHRVDALTLAFRVELHEPVMRALEERQKVAREHGRASFVVELAAGHELDFGELRYSRVSGVWNLFKDSVYQIRIDLQAPGAVHDANDERREPGWTVEFVWRAQTLARHKLDDLLAMTRRLVAALGKVFEERCRRIDLCADVAGLEVSTIDPRNIIKRARARDTDYENQPEATRSEHDEGLGSSVFRERQVCGIVVGKDALACRIYDKPAELARETRHVPGNDECGCRRCAEEARWRLGGWKPGEPVTRIEYQLRGIALKEFGCQNPAACVELRKDGEGNRKLGAVKTLPEYIDALWQALLDWARVAEPGEDARTRWVDTEAWRHLRKLRFTDGADVTPAGRARVRGAASGAQTLGSALSYAAQQGVLERQAERPEAYAGGGDAAEWERLLGLVRPLLGAAIAEPIARELAARWGSVPGACAHFAVRQNAAIARFVGDEASLIEQLKRIQQEPLKEPKGVTKHERWLQQRADDGAHP